MARWSKSRPRGVGQRLLKMTLLGIGALCGTLLLTILAFRWLPVPTSAFMLGHSLSGGGPAYRWVAWEGISTAVPIAVVAAEDQNFPFHWGFDFQAIAQALDDNRHRRHPRGASTISQQVAKNLFLWSGRSWLRKGLEAGLTVVLEVCWPKRRILEVYLNIAQFGPGVFGVAAAAQHHFGVPPSALTPYQAALLAAVLPHPSTYRPHPPSAYMRRRAAFIQRQVRQLGGPAYLADLDR